MDHTPPKTGLPVVKPMNTDDVLPRLVLSGAGMVAHRLVESTVAREPGTVVKRGYRLDVRESSATV